MYSLIPFILIVVSFAAILFIIIRKFPQLTLLDVDNLPEVKEGRKKDLLLKKKANERMKQVKERSARQLSAVVSALQKTKGAVRGYAGSVKQKIDMRDQGRQMKKTEKEIAAPQSEESADTETIHQLLREAQDAFDGKALETAEERFIGVIKLDPKNIAAYRGLADVYYAQGHISEAKETYLFLLQLSPQDDSVMVKLGDIAKEYKEIDEAISWYEKAVLINPHLASRFGRLAEFFQEIERYDSAIVAIEEALDLEEKNPKYLDTLLELAILVRNKNFAERALQQLRLVNPENQKLDTFKERIRALD